MSDEFKIEIDNWLSGSLGVPEIRETVAEVSIQVNGSYATEIEDRRARCVRKTVRVSGLCLSFMVSLKLVAAQMGAR